MFLFICQRDDVQFTCSFASVSSLFASYLLRWPVRFMVSKLCLSECIKLSGLASLSVSHHECRQLFEPFMMVCVLLLDSSLHHSCCCLLSAFYHVCECVCTHTNDIMKAASCIGYRVYTQYYMFMVVCLIYLDMMRATINEMLAILLCHIVIY